MNATRTRCTSPVSISRSLITNNKSQASPLALANWLRTITSDQTAYNNSSLSFSFELVGVIRLDRNYWQVISLLFVLPILFDLNILKNCGNITILERKVRKWSIPLYLPTPDVSSQTSEKSSKGQKYQRPSNLILSESARTEREVQISGNPKPARQSRRAGKGVSRSANKCVREERSRIVD